MQPRRRQAKEDDARPARAQRVDMRTRLVPKKYSIAGDTIVYFMNFDVWGVESHPQGSRI